MLWVHAVLLKPPRGPTPSVLTSQCLAWPKKLCGKTDLAISCQCMSASMIWNTKMHFTCCVEMVSFSKSGHKCRGDMNTTKVNQGTGTPACFWYQDETCTSAPTTRLKLLLLQSDYVLQAGGPTQAFKRSAGLYWAVNKQFLFSNNVVHVQLRISLRSAKMYHIPFWLFRVTQTLFMQGSGDT